MHKAVSCSGLPEASSLHEEVMADRIQSEPKGYLSLLAVPIQPWDTRPTSSHLLSHGSWIMDRRS